MAEEIGKLVAFVGTLFQYFWESFTSDTAPFFVKVAEGPLDHPFETVIVAFLVSAAAAMAIGLAWSVIRFSPIPLVRVVEIYVRFFGYVGSWILVLLIVSMVYEVVARYFFDAPTKWAFEMAYMLMGASFMLGIALCMQMRRHIRVDFLYDHVSRRWQAVIDLVGYVLLIPMLLWLTAGMWEYFHAAYRTDETSGESAWNPIIWPFKFTFVMGFVLLLMQTFLQMIKSILVLAGREVPETPIVEGLQ